MMIIAVDILRDLRQYKCISIELLDTVADTRRSIHEHGHT